MQNTPFLTGPIALSTTLGTNLLNPPTLAGGVGITPAKTFILVKHIRVVNTTAGNVSASFFKGATGAAAAGTEVGASATPVLANAVLDIYFPPSGLRLETVDFLTGGGSATGLTVTITGEIGICT
jgi:hypothetical protein